MPIRSNNNTLLCFSGGIELWFCMRSETVFFSLGAVELHPFRFEVSWGGSACGGLDSTGIGSLSCLMLVFIFCSSFGLDLRSLLSSFDLLGLKS